MKFHNVLATFVLAGAVSSAIALETNASKDARWVAGGVSTDAREEMLQALPNYNLKVFTAEKGSGAFLANAHVRVSGPQGTLIDAPLEGPWLLARLAPGRYDVSATLNGNTQKRTVQVSTGGQAEVAFYWPIPGADTLGSTAQRTR